MGFLFPYNINNIEIESQVPEKGKEKRRKLACTTVAMTEHQLLLRFLAAKTEGEAAVLCHSGSPSLQVTHHLGARVGTLIDTIMNVLGNSFPTKANFCLSFLVKTFH